MKTERNWQTIVCVCVHIKAMREIIIIQIFQHFTFCEDDLKRHLHLWNFIIKLKLKRMGFHAMRNRLCLCALVHILPNNKAYV